MPHHSDDTITAVRYAAIVDLDMQVSVWVSRNEWSQEQDTYRHVESRQDTYHQLESDHSLQMHTGKERAILRSVHTHSLHLRISRCRRPRITEIWGEVSQSTQKRGRMIVDRKLRWPGNLLQTQFVTGDEASFSNKLSHTNLSCCSSTCLSIHSSDWFC